MHKTIINFYVIQIGNLCKLLPLTLFKTRSKNNFCRFVSIMYRTKRHSGYYDIIYYGTWLFQPWFCSYPVLCSQIILWKENFFQFYHHIRVRKIQIELFHEAISELCQHILIISNDRLPLVSYGVGVFT